MNNKEKVVAELRKFCENIEKWFRGEADQETLYHEILSGFSPDFRMINGDGDAVSFHMFSDWLPTVYGKFPSRSVTLENVDIQYSDKHGLATYTEIQITEDVNNQRKASAVFLLEEDKALWLHLIEEWI
ncbi:hypothetical protein DSC47_10425 [Elizabethkingia miricola]|uniref:DUF4440 domain-containing protein n=1 Tax=Elizabethkingia bruuniana TaxID=1756149 RepID=A0A7T7ZXC9_9FLAO|nr:hypothetical protein [Elizabethkingia bruuniana]KGO08607.1 hypothetical protein KS04_18745 [Elizabethkingia miricola]AQX83963.1 hypothetical protein AYC65_02530 [Elizabethkingia bruuniana]KUY28214.1 hypothetical protein ATB97_14915 [Elizabethkingia bruuniana]OPB64382.1 hypothetical protein BAY12_06170 [Elizabethkingia bruuniana]OPC62600.1 hypothetical protein BAY13_07250 [Elizabethkingia bruuniana]